MRDLLQRCLEPAIAPEASLPGEAEKVGGRDKERPGASSAQRITCPDFLTGHPAAQSLQVLMIQGLRLSSELAKRLLRAGRVRTGACVLRIYERRKGDASTQNTLTFFATRRLESCTCSWTLYSSNVDD
jgi:hypothetical protein